MASPFTVFRRNQKIMLAVVGIGAMVAFVFLDPLTNYLGRSRAPDNPVVVETSYGNLKQTDLANLRQARELVELFIMRACGETVNAQINRGQLDPRMRDAIAQNMYNYWHQELMGRSKPGPEEAAVETMILARRRRSWEWWSAIGRSTTCSSN